MFFCSSQKDQGPNRPKFEWPLSTGTKRRRNMFGHCIPTSKIGRTNQENESNFWSLFTFISFISILCITSTFNVKSQTITIGSHNLHSFKTSVDYHKSCIQSHSGIWFAQELWLSEKQLHLLHQLNTQFTARSGMEQSLSSGVMRGRPYG